MIVIEKDTIIYIDQNNEVHEIFSTDLPSHLGDALELGDFVTFSRIFDLIIDNRELFNTIFAEDLGFYRIDQFLEEYHKPASHTKDIYDLEVHIVCQAHTYTDYRDFLYYTSFQGFGKLENDHESEEPYPISLSLTPLNELKNKYIRINDKVQVCTFTEEGNVDKSIIYDSQIKLFSFFSAILHEISFFGDPDDRDGVSDEMEESEEIYCEEEEEEVPWEDLKNEWQEEIEKADKEEEKARLENLKDQISSGYLKDFIESTYHETILKLETLEKDLVSLERYEDASLVKGKIDKLKL